MRSNCDPVWSQENNINMSSSNGSLPCDLFDTLVKCIYVAGSTVAWPQETHTLWDRAGTSLPGCPRLGTVLTCCLCLKQVVVHWTGGDRLVGFIPTNMLVCRAKGDAALILKNPLPSHKSLHYLIYLLTHSQDLSHVRHATLPIFPSHLLILGEIIFTDFS